MAGRRKKDPLTFEQFFEKKKIDLAAYRQAEPQAVQQLEEAYAVMGETSFDQRKKFLFNDLRLAYPLQQTGAAAPK